MLQVALLTHLACLIEQRVCEVEKERGKTKKRRKKTQNGVTAGQAVEQETPN